jgi:aromatic ring-opening dioxygenase catalytic subunit (LigB family)
MAEFVGAFATSHGPLIAREWDILPEGPKAKLKAAFDETGRRLKALEPDVLVMLSPDHWVNFFIDNLPSFCIGIGEEHDGPPEPFMKPIYPHKTLSGHPAFGRHLLETALKNDFDPAISHRLTLDHGFCVPLWRMGIDPALPIVPITVNQLEEPLPTLRRCIAWGRMLRKAIETYPGDIRVAVLGTGGLSHSIGEPTMGEIDEPFDRICIDLFTNADDDALADGLERALATTGNGAQEVRDWVIAHAVAGSQGFDLIDYTPIPEVYIGCGMAEWRPAA